jgi:hypothetical protein
VSWVHGDRCVVAGVRTATEAAARRAGLEKEEKKL